jgi:hypothetical protein
MESLLELALAEKRLLRELKVDGPQYSEAVSHLQTWLQIIERELRAFKVSLSGKQHLSIGGGSNALVSFCGEPLYSTGRSLGRWYYIQLRLSKVDTRKLWCRRCERAFKRRLRQGDWS